MIVLTKTALREILVKVLKEAFEPKFADLQKRLVQYVLEWRRTQHPVFDELLARKDAAPYLHTRLIWLLYAGEGEPMKYPNYEAGGDGGRIATNEVTIPVIDHSESLTVDDQNICETYRNLRRSCDEARSELLKLLAAYRTVEALLIDFPEYAKYLPAPTVKQLPVVIPAESRAKLSALGVPADK